MWRHESRKFLFQITSNDSYLKEIDYLTGTNSLRSILAFTFMAIIYHNVGLSQYNCISFIYSTVIQPMFY